MDDIVYLSLGSNIGDSCSIIRRALNAIDALAEVKLLCTSSLYRTSPVSHVPQADFINATCALTTSLSPEALYDTLHRIEVLFGKTPKEKYAPRSLDIDILFFGNLFYQTSTLSIPHPHWRERLFVLAPLSEIVKEIQVPLSDDSHEVIHLETFLNAFPNPHHERIIRLTDHRQ